MNISNEAIEAAARVMDTRALPRDNATAALTAAAPAIQAAALRDEAGHLMVNMTEPSGEAYRILHERANSIEGKES